MGQRGGHVGQLPPVPIWRRPCQGNVLDANTFSVFLAGQKLHMVVTFVVILCNRF